MTSKLGPGPKPRSCVYLLCRTLLGRQGDGYIAWGRYLQITPLMGYGWGMPSGSHYVSEDTLRHPRQLNLRDGSDICEAQPRLEAWASEISSLEPGSARPRAWAQARKTLNPSIL